MSDFQLPIQNLVKDTKQKLVKISISDLPDNESLLSPGPSRVLIEDIGLRGQTTPILVTLDESGKYIVIAGRRRIKAIRALHETFPDDWKTVNAIVVEKADNTSIATLTTVENNLRSDNPLTDLQTITYLMTEHPGISESELSRVTGIPISRIRKRLKLSSLIPEIKQAVVENKINVFVAENIAKLNDNKQSELLSVYLNNGKITLEDVVVVQRARVQDSVDTLPPFFDMEVYDDTEVGFVVVNTKDNKINIINKIFDTLEEANEKKDSILESVATVYKLIKP